MGEPIKSAADFFAAAALAEQELALPDGRAIRIRELSVLQRAEFLTVQRERSSEVPAWLCVQGCYSPEGFRLFADDDAGQLMLSSPRLVEYASLAILRLSGLLGGKQGNA